jgi:ribosomal protein S12 methylthiotransferase accessory factor
MLHRPALKPRFQALAVAGEGAVLLAEDDDRVLRGEIFGHVVPLLDGARTTEEIVARLEPEREPAEVFYALMQLEELGVLGESAGTAEEAGGGALRMLDVALEGLGRLPLVVTDSYLREELADINARHLASGRPWLLARTAGTALWLGPLLRPGTTCCWRCLEHRLRRNRPFEYQLVRRSGGARPLAGRAVGPAAVRASLAALALTHAAELEGTLVAVDVRSDTRRREQVTRRPQCPACGDPGLHARESGRPFALHSRPKRFTADGGHRAVTPEETVASFARLVAPLTGVVRDVRTAGPDADDLLRVCLARYGVDPELADQPLLESGLRQASGKGMAPAQAMASGLGEAIERWCGAFQGDEPRRLGTLEELGAQALHPNLCMQFSDAQYAGRAAWNARASRWHQVPRPLDPAERLEWTPVWSLMAGAPRYLPTAFLYSGYPGARLRGCAFDPNGNAAGNTREEAAVQGLMELIERDALAIWWYGRVRRPALDLDAVDDPWCRRLRRFYRALGREVWVLDLTTDLGVTVFAAVSRRTGEGPEALLFGFGAHLEPRIALARALTELNQVLSHVTEAQRAGKALEATMASWLAEATLAGQPHLAPADAPRVGLDAFPDLATDDLADDLLASAALLARAGLEAFVLDQTRPDVGVPVVKVVVPGLRHFRARHAPGRLYSVSVAMGWRDRPLAETELNPIPFFL